MLTWKGARQNQGKIWAWNSQQASTWSWKSWQRREQRGGKWSGGGSWLGDDFFNRGCWVFHTLTLVQLVLLHDDVLQLGAHFLFLLLDRGGLPAVFLIHLPSTPESTSAPSGSSVWVYIVAHDGGLDELCGGVRCRLAPRTHKASIFKVGAVEGLHLIDLVGQVHISIHSRLWHHEVGLLVFHLVVIIGNAVGWRTWAGCLVSLVCCWSALQHFASFAKTIGHHVIYRAESIDLTKARTIKSSCGTFEKRRPPPHPPTREWDISISI